MIKVIHILIIMVLLTPQRVYCDDLNGYSWERMDESYRYLLVTGYIHGFRHGTVYGSDFGLNKSSQLLKDLSKKPVYGVRIFKDYSLCGTSIDKNREPILEAAAKHARNSLTNSVEYYVNDVDSFYRRYPLCRGKELMSMLTDISLVWLKMRTHEEIGEECPLKESSPAKEGKAVTIDPVKRTGTAN